MGYACPEYREALRLDDVNKVLDTSRKNRLLSSFPLTVLFSPLCAVQYAATYSSNFHKQGLVHFDCSALWVRDRKLLSDALNVTPEVSLISSLLIL